MSDISGEPIGATKLGGVACPVTAQREGAAVAVAGSRNARLQYLRGFAAVAVLLYHSAAYLEQLRGDARFLSVFSGYWGAYGVAVFFVLSGYLMAGLSTRGDPMRFLLDRILRIYPLLLLVVALAALAYLATGFGRRPDLVALTLVPAGPRDYFLGVEWTLLFEMTYYVAITAMMLAGLRRWLEPLFAAWLAALAITNFVAPAEAILTPTLTQLFGQPANAAFLMGFLLPVLLRRRWLPPVRVLYAGAALVALLFLVLSNGADRWVAALSSLLLVAGALKAPPVFASGLLHRIGLRLGDSSYALYLCHVPVIVVSSNLLSQAVPGYALWGGWTLASLALALALGPIDLRIHARLKRWAGGLSRQRIMLGSAAFLALFAGIAVIADVNARLAARQEAAARAALADSTPQAWPTVITEIDSANVLNDGRLVVRGYGIDLLTPNDDAHVAVRQGDRIIGFDRMRRMRPQIAKAVKRPDIASIRFGFSVVTSGPLLCADGPLSASLILPDGRIAPIGTDVLDTLCPKRPVARTP